MSMSVVRWIHFSDLHSMLGAESEGLRHHIVNGTNRGGTNRRSLKKVDDEVVLTQAGVKGLIKKYPIDCVIITGDIFNKGSWDSSISADASKFIRELANLGGKSKTSPSVLICAGNHDLQRDVSIIQNGLPISRAQVIKQVADKSSSIRGEGYVTCDEPQKCVINAAFEPFDTFVSNLRSEPSSTADGNVPIPDNKVKICPGTGVTADIVRCADNGEPSVAFIGINSAYLSGQPCNREECEQRMREEYEQFLIADRQMNIKDAAQHYKSYSQVAQQLVMGVGEDVGKLSLPFHDAFEKAENIVKENQCPVSVIYMHHPVEFLCDEARKSLSNFLEKVGGQIILCGHVHRPTLERDLAVAPSTSYSRERVIQVSSGGSFPDSEGYNCVSFSIGSVERIENFKKYRISVDLYSYAKSPLGKWFWHHDNFSKEVIGAYFDNDDAAGPNRDELATEASKNDSSNAGNWEDNNRDEQRNEERKRAKDQEIIDHQELLFSMMPAMDKFGLGERRR